MSVRLWTGAVLAASLAPLCSSSVKDLEVGAPTPEFTLETVAGDPVSFPGEASLPSVLVFGEVDHANTRAALHALEDVITRQRVEDALRLILIVSDRVPPERDALDRVNPEVPLEILTDPDRTTFVNYGVISAIPCLFFITEDGRLQHAVSGYNLSLPDVAHAQVAHLTGQIDERELIERMEASGPVEEAGSRLAREVRLADNLRRRGFDQQAGQRYQSVLDEAPENIDAHLGLAVIDFDGSDLESAQSHTSAVLSQRPDHPRGLKMLARIQLRRGDLEEAEATLRDLINRVGEDVQTIYLQGELAERRGDDPAALRHYRQACETLLPREDW